MDELMKEQTAILIHKLTSDRWVDGWMEEQTDILMNTLTSDR